MFENITRKFYYPGASDASVQEPTDGNSTTGQSSSTPDGSYGTRYFTSEEKDLACRVLLISNKQIADGGDMDGVLCYENGAIVPNADFPKVFFGPRCVVCIPGKMNKSKYVNLANFYTRDGYNVISYFVDESTYVTIGGENQDAAIEYESASNAE